MRDYRSLKNAGVVKFGNNHKCQVKGYGKVMNGKFTVKRVAYVEGLWHNLISVSQLVVGTGNQVVFNEEGSIISNVNTNEVLLNSKRYGDMFILDIKPIVGIPFVCLLSKASSDVSWLWHWRLSHLNFRNLNKLVVNDLVIMVLEFIKKIERILKKKVRKIKSDNRLEFKNNVLDSFLTDKGISHNFSSPYTPHKNGVVERRNWTLCEANRTMLTYVNLPQYL